MQQAAQPTMNTRGNKKSDGFINLKVEFTDANGTIHAIKPPMFGLDADDALHAALIANPNLKEHIHVEITSINPARTPIQAADLALDFESQVDAHEASAQA